MGLQYVEEMNGRLVPEDEALAGGNSMHRVPMGHGLCSYRVELFIRIPTIWCPDLPRPL